MTPDIMFGRLDRYPGSGFPSRPGRSTCNVSLSPIDRPVDRAHAHASDFPRIDIDAAQLNELQAQIGSRASTDDGRLTWRRALRLAIHDRGERR